MVYCVGVLLFGIVEQFYIVDIIVLQVEFLVVGYWYIIQVQIVIECYFVVVDVMFIYLFEFVVVDWIVQEIGEVGLEIEFVIDCIDCVLMMWVVL